MTTYQSEQECFFDNIARLLQLRVNSKMVDDCSCTETTCSMTNPTTDDESHFTSGYQSWTTTPLRTPPISFHRQEELQQQQHQQQRQQQQQQQFFRHNSFEDSSLQTAMNHWMLPMSKTHQTLLLNRQESICALHNLTRQLSDASSHTLVPSRQTSQNTLDNDGKEEVLTIVSVNDEDRPTDEIDPFFYEQMRVSLCRPLQIPNRQYSCDICHVRGSHFITDCPLRHGRREEITPYQGPKQCYGEYQCPKCKRKWTSRKSFSNVGQNCQKCKVVVYPKKQFPLEKCSNSRRLSSECLSSFPVDQQHCFCSLPLSLDDF